MKNFPPQYAEDFATPVSCQLSAPFPRRNDLGDLFFLRWARIRFRVDWGPEMNLKVVDADGKRMTFANATGRAFGLMLSCLILGIGFLLGLFNPARQCLHDTLAKTYVTDNEAPTEG